MANISKLPSGKFRALVRLDGHYKSKTFDNKTQAKSWSIEVERQIKELVVSGFIDPKQLTVDFVIKEYLSDVNPRGKTKLAVLKSLRTQLGKHHPNKLNTHLQTFINKRIEDGVVGATISGDLSFLATALD